MWNYVTLHIFWRERGKCTLLFSFVSPKKRLAIPGACAMMLRFLLTCCIHLFSQGYTTMQLACSQEMHNMGYAWKTIKEQLGEEIENVIHRMTFLKGKTVCTHSMCINKIMFLLSAHLTTVCIVLYLEQIQMREPSELVPLLACQRLGSPRLLLANNG